MSSTSYQLYRVRDIYGATIDFIHEYQGLTTWEVAATRDLRFLTEVESAKDDLRTYATGA